MMMSEMVCCCVCCCCVVRLCYGEVKMFMSHADLPPPPLSRFLFIHTHDDGWTLYQQHILHSVNPKSSSHIAVMYRDVNATYKHKKLCDLRCRHDVCLSTSLSLNIHQVLNFIVQRPICHRTVLSTKSFIDVNTCEFGSPQNT